MKSRITKKEALALLKKADLLELGRTADSMRKKLHPERVATFVIDRNINYTNICVNQCAFCAFWRPEESGYVLGREELFNKIDETIKCGGTQILIQGGLNPALDFDFYSDMLRAIKERFDISIHGFSPPEICYISDGNSITIKECLTLLREAGLDSMPGGGAEILSDRVRKKLSPKKIRTQRWLCVMEEAHRLGMRTTATMMFGALEGPEDIIEHLECIRTLQDKTGGFTAFIPWPFQPGNTKYEGKIEPATAVEYLRVLAVSRLYLDNIQNIQASWVTQGVKLAEAALRWGANDMGSTMLEENVVSATGVSHAVSIEDIISAIRNAGFVPAQRDTVYNIIRKF